MAQTYDKVIKSTKIKMFEFILFLFYQMFCPDLIEMVSKEHNGFLLSSNPG